MSTSSHIKAKHATVRKIDAALEIIDLFPGAAFPFDCVVANLNGVHPWVVNHVSDRLYYVLEGTGTILVGDETYATEKGDVVTIKAGTPHSPRGEMQYIIITSPPFDPQNEQVLEK